MSSSRPPQIPLPIAVGEGRGTSFKRSFEQYGIDLNTTPGGESSGSGSSLSASSERDERNKRARSESRTAESSGSSTSLSDEGSISGTSSFLTPMDMEEDGLSSAHPISVDEELFPTSIPQNLATIGETSQTGLQGDPRISPPPIPSTSDHLRASLERFSAFDEEISALRRTTNAPPTLPPISLLTDNQLFNLDMDEYVGVPGLQVFTLGEFQTHAASNSLADGSSQVSSVLRPGSTSRMRPSRESMSASIHSSPEAWFDTESSISSGLSTRGTDYMPPRDWFDTPASASDEPIRDEPSHRQEIPSSISNIFRLLEDEERLLNRSFPTRTLTDERQARGPSAPGIPNEHDGHASEAFRRFSRVDWPPRASVRRMPMEPLVRGDYTNLGRNSDVLPIIDTSDFEIDFPSNARDPHAPPRYTSSRPTSSMETEPRNMRNLVPSRRSDWAPQRMPPMQRFGPLPRGSGLPSSNSLVSETAAEMRRTISRSHMLPSIPRYDDYSFEFSSPSEPGIPWRDRRQEDGSRRQEDGEELDTFSGVGLRTRNAEPLPPSRHDATPSQVMEIYAPLPPSRRGTLGDNNAHRTEAAPSNASLGRLQYGVRANPSSHVAAPNSPMTSAPTSPLLSDWSDDRMRHPHRLSRPEGFEARTDRPRAFSAVGHDSNDELRSRARIRAAVDDVTLFQSPSPPPARDRGSPLTAEPPRVSTGSAYESLDMSVYHQGPFRASLQRSLDLDRIRSRLERREFLADPTPMSSTSTRAALPPSLPPLRFDSHADLYMDRQPRATPGSAAEHSQSSTDANLNFPHLVREARLGRSNIPEPPPLQNALAYGGHAMSNANVRDPRIEGTRRCPWRPRMDTVSTDGHSTLQATRRERQLPGTPFLHSSGATSQNYPAEEDFSNSFPSAPRPSAFQAAAASRQAEAQERRNSLRAQIRPPLGASAAAHGLRPASSTRRNGISGDFREALDILSADGLSESTTRSLFDRYLEANEDRERTSVVEDTSEAGPRVFPSRARYPRRGRLSTEAEPSQTLHLPRFRPTERTRTSSISPTRGSLDRMPGTSSAVLNTARRAVRARAHRDQDIFMSDFPRFDIHFAHRVRRNVGDYVRDEDFDSSYESLMTLASTLGEVRPRSTPSDVIASLPTGTYHDWRTSDSDERCPICLDDYQPSDPLLKLSDCSHWLHKDCLQQWLHGANTCPVCRKRVNGRNARRTAGDDSSARSGSNSHRRNDPDFGFDTPPWRIYE